MHTPLKQITLKKLVNDRLHLKDRLWAFSQAEGVTHLVVFQNITLDSSRLGDETILAIGPAMTYKTLAEVEGRHLYDLPSQRQYPQAFVDLSAPDVGEGD
jgi:hypothetical protein